MAKKMLLARITNDHFLSSFQLSMSNVFETIRVPGFRSLSSLRAQLHIDVLEQEQGPGVALILDIDLKLREQPSVAGEVLIL